MLNVSFLFFIFFSLVQKSHNDKNQNKEQGNEKNDSQNNQHDKKQEEKKDDEKNKFSIKEKFIYFSVKNYSYFNYNIENKKIK